MRSRYDECYIPNANNCLRIFYTNADSLSNKTPELQSIINTNSLDILCVTETKPKSNLNFTPIELDNLGYMSFHNNTGRGVSIYIKNSIPAEAVEIDTDFCVSQWVKINIKSSTVLIGCIYRSPNSTQENNTQLINLLQKAVDLNSGTTLIMGDFNYKEIDWKNNHVKCGPDHPASKIHDAINDLFLSQLVTEPTRFREGETQNTLDWVITDSPNKIGTLNHGPPLGERGDHCTLTFNLEISFQRKDKGGNFQFSKGNFLEFRSYMRDIDWEEEFRNKTVEEAWSLFQNKMTIAIHRFIPKSRPKLHKSPPWTNSSTRVAIKNKNRAWSIYKRHKNETNWASFKEARNKCNRDIRMQKKEFEKNIAANVKRNPKIFWNYVKYATGGQKEIPPIKNDQGLSITDDKDKAELFNDYFCEVYTVEDLSQLPDVSGTTNTPTLDQCTLTLEVVKKQLDKLNISKAAGPDQIHPKILHELRDVLAFPLFKIFHKSLAEAKLPPQWKEAYIKPIFKKGSKHMASNYRPVSLTSVCCKILERIIRHDVMNHLETNDLINSNQHGFRSGRSCCTQLLELMEIWTRLIDEGNAWDCIYLDFAKAFDKVPHHRLTMKLSKMGIKGNLHKWLCDFLNNRYQAVVIKDSKSAVKEVTSGIPQGSVLGPIMFIIYINDLPDVVNSYVKIFADDTKLFRIIANNEDQQLLQSDLKALYNWSIKWQLKFNESKCKVIHYGNRNLNCPYTLNNIELEASSNEKDLGVTFDDKLKFSKHVSSITAKANSRLAIIKRTMNELTIEIFLPLYKSLVRPLLEYCSTIWNPLLKGDKDEIEKVQRRATKLVKEIAHLDYNERLYKLKLDSLNFRRRRADLIQVFRIVKEFDKIDSNLFFTFSDNSITRGHNRKIFKPNSNCNIRSNSFSLRIINDWNSLPQEAVDCETINSFKTILKRFWADHPERYDMP